MDDKAAQPRRIKHSETLDRLNRLRWDFACKPYMFEDERWSNKRISASLDFEHVQKEQQQKRMIREVDQGVKGLDFPAEEMALIIRGMMAQDED